MVILPSSLVSSTQVASRTKYQIYHITRIHHYQTTHILTQRYRIHLVIRARQSPSRLLYQQQYFRREVYVSLITLRCAGGLWMRRRWRRAKNASSTLMN